MSSSERDAALGDVTLSLLCRPDQFTWQIDAPVGQVDMDRSFYQPMLQALEKGPQRVSALLDLHGSKRGNAGEVVGMLVGTGQATPVLAQGAEPDPTVRRLNEAAARRFLRPDNFSASMALATSGAGVPLLCPMLDLFVASKLQTSPEAGPAAWAKELAVDHPETEQQRLQEFITKLVADRAPIWRRLGALPASSGL